LGFFSSGFEETTHLQSEGNCNLSENRWKEKTTTSSLEKNLNIKGQIRLILQL
jgi:hypothetical protein